MALAARLTRALGSDSVDFRLRQSDFRGDGRGSGVPWLGMPVAAIDGLDRVLVVGSLLRKEHPLLAQRLRQAAKKGAQVSFLNPVDDEPLLKVRHSLVAAPSLMPLALAEIVVAAARAAGQPVPPALNSIEPREMAEAIAASLAGAKAGAVLLGNLAEQHGDASQLLALAQELARLTGASLGCLGEAANSVGGHFADALPRSGGLDAARMLTAPRRAYLVVGAEPELDCANPVAARVALEGADFVVVLSAFRHAHSYADVLLPIAPFTETAGTFVNCEGRAQSFNGVVRPAGDARPGWKVLRALGSTLELPGFRPVARRPRARFGRRSRRGEARRRTELCDSEHAVRRLSARGRRIGGRRTVSSAAFPEKIPGEKGSGIHVWNTDGYRITGNQITGVRDGFYIQSSPHGVILRNVARDLRYGLHYMFSDDNRFEDNTFENGDAGHWR